MAAAVVAVVAEARPCGGDNADSSLDVEGEGRSAVGDSGAGSTSLGWCSIDFQQRLLCRSRAMWGLMASPNTTRSLLYKGKAT